MYLSQVVQTKTLILRYTSSSGWLVIDWPSSEISGLTQYHQRLTQSSKPKVLHKTPINEKADHSTGAMSSAGKTDGAKFGARAKRLSAGPNFAPRWAGGKLCHIRPRQILEQMGFKPATLW
ncbi:hypothetical protein PoB_002552200 [Plakobranchus ocellatus]|uniref:Uncharacterized protein n=1 Tax=Plakobranchus ocellatus TaxID=259542 RepID=A0AAV3ZVA5_9GAST|nr:hypothetical protein PoB_002552200 [Plakobranchus ocellatus]